MSTDVFIPPPDPPKCPRHIDRIRGQRAPIDPLYYLCNPSVNPWEGVRKRSNWVENWGGPGTTWDDPGSRLKAPKLDRLNC